MPKRQKSIDRSSETCKPSNEYPPKTAKPVSAEKEPVRRLRYYSNYLTAEGNFVQKYFGPALAFGRGFLFNLLLILPLLNFVAVLLSALYKIPDFSLGDMGFGPIRSHFQMGRLNEALDKHSKAVKTYEQFILSEAKNFSSNLTFSERVEIIKATPTLTEREKIFK